MHAPEWYKHLYEDWFSTYRKKGFSTEKAAKSALSQVQKHTSDGNNSKPPFWLRVGARVAGGKEMATVASKSWSAIDGKKTAIGAVLTFLVLVGPQVNDLAIQLGVTQDGLAIVTAALGIVGVAHKIWKRFFANGNNS